MRLGSFTGAAAGGALVGGLIAGFGIDEAAKFQIAMAVVKNATAATTEQFQKLNAVAIKTAGYTGQSATTMAQELAVAAKGLNNPNQLIAAFPQIAKAADVAWISSGKKQDPVEAVKLLTQLAHLFGAFSGPKLAKLMDDAVKLMLLQPEDLQKLVTQGGYFVTSALAAGVDEPTIMRHMAAMGVIGQLRSKGGTGLRAIVDNLVGMEALTGHMAGSKRKAFKTLDIGRGEAFQFEDKQGHLQLEKLESHLYNIYQHLLKTDPRHGRGTFEAALRNAFDATGSRLLASLITPTMQARMAQQAKSMSESPGVDKQWETFNQTFAFVFSKFFTNIRTLIMTVFLPELPELTKFFDGLANSIGHLTDFIVAHPGTAQNIARATIALTGLLAAAAGLGGATMALQGLKALRLVTLLAPVGPAAAVALGTVFIAALPQIAGMAQHWWLNHKGQVAESIGAAFAEIAEKFNLAIMDLPDRLANAIGSLPGRVVDAVKKKGINALRGGGVFDHPQPKGTDQAESAQHGFLRGVAKRWGELHPAQVGHSVSGVFGAPVQPGPTIIHELHLHLPNVKDSYDVVSTLSGGKLHSLLNNSGALRTSPGLPGPMTVRGAGLAY